MAFVMVTLLLGLMPVPRVSASVLFHGAPGDGPPGPSFRRAPGTSVVGGGITTNSKYPWQALLRINSFRREEACGGSLIHPLIVVTAAHCLVGSNGQYREGLEVSVWLGDTEQFEGNEVHEGVFFVVPNGYNPDAHPRTPLILDLALIALDSPSQRPRILLAGPDERALWTAGRGAYISGWGSTEEDGDLSDFLIEARTPIVDDGVCGGPEVNGSEFVFSVMVCAGDLAGGVDACDGDSGGPLQSPIDGGGFRLTGITSWGHGCGQPNSPGVYTRIAADPMEAFVREGVSSIEQAEGFPPEYMGIGVVGRGARPPGCAAAEQALINATLAAKAALHAEQVAAGALRKGGKRLRGAKRSVKLARLRGSAKHLAKASKKLREARSHERTVKQVLARDRITLAQINSALAEALERHKVVCG